MRISRLLILSLAILLGPALSRAYAVSIRDLVELSHAGVSDAVLVALIETDGSRFALTPDDIKSLKADGIGDAVVIAMIKTKKPVRDTSALPPAGGLYAPPDETAAPAPAPAPPVAPQPPPVVVQQTVIQKVEQPRHTEPPQQVAVPVYVPVYVPARRPVEPKKPEPEYWGFGGKLRPDAWPIKR